MNRAEALGRLSEPFDIVVIGGGATGLGTAVDAAARGFRVALFEAKDFASGTSSRSTKLVHGGVRYLAGGHVGLVREALRERGRLLANAPHLVRNLTFVVPAYDWWTGPYIGVGLKLYDVLAGRHRMGRTRSLNAAQVLEHVPTLREEGLRGGLLYFDGQFDDSRLAMALVRSADSLGAVVLNHTPITSIRKTGDRVTGVVVVDSETSTEYVVSARVVVNATGVFADRVRRLEDPEAPPTLVPSQGAHLVLPERYLPGGSAVIIPKTEDGRVLFVIPWKRRALVGTTDIAVPEIGEEPRPLEEELEFLFSHTERYLSLPLRREDALSCFAGLRPLVRRGGPVNDTRTVSRDHEVMVSGGGMITVVGGKWTTYRQMGEDAVDEAIKVGDLEKRPSTTAALRLWGTPGEGPVPGDDPLAIYGTDAGAIRELGRGDSKLASPVHPRLGLTGAEVVWFARHEQARTVADVLSRRSRWLLLDARAAAEAAGRVAELLAGELGRDEAWQREQVASFEALAERHLPGPAPAVSPAGESAAS